MQDIEKLSEKNCLSNEIINTDSDSDVIIKQNRKSIKVNFNGIEKIAGKHRRNIS